MNSEQLSELNARGYDVASVKPSAGGADIELVLNDAERDELSREGIDSDPVTDAQGRTVAERAVQQANNGYRVFRDYDGTDEPGGPSRNRGWGRARRPAAVVGDQHRHLLRADDLRVHRDRRRLGGDSRVRRGRGRQRRQDPRCHPPARSSRTAPAAALGLGPDGDRARRPGDHVHHRRLEYARLGRRDPRPDALRRRPSASGRSSGSSTPRSSPCGCAARRLRSGRWPTGCSTSSSRSRSCC